MNLTTSDLKACVGAGCLVLRADAVLLVRLNYGRFKGQWILPGGLCSLHERPEEAALRECFEETGLLARVLRAVAVRFRSLPDGNADLYWVFKAELDSRYAQQSNTELPLAWPKEELMDVRFWPLTEAMGSTEVRPMTQYFIALTRALGQGSSLPQLPDANIKTDVVYPFQPPSL